MMRQNLILHPAWVVGFIDGEGTFYIGIMKNATMAVRYQVQLQFSITQHIRDTDLMLKIQSFFDCGSVVNDGKTKKQFRIRHFGDLETKLFPLLEKYPLQTQKKLDALSFREVHRMMKSGLHLTSHGLEQIRAVQATMNRARMTQYKSPYYSQLNMIESHQYESTVALDYRVYNRAKFLGH